MGDALNTRTLFIGMLIAAVAQLITTSQLTAQTTRVSIVRRQMAQRPATENSENL
jgi:hypothetical protein